MTEYSINRIDYLVSMGAELEARDFRDVYDSLEYLYRAFVVEERVEKVEIFKAKILNLFDDNDLNCVILSSIHRAGMRWS